MRRPDTSWARGSAARIVREAMLLGVFGPLIDLYTRGTVVGREHLAAVSAPVLFVANHSSHMDTPVVLRALPTQWRRRTAVAAAADYFYRVPWLAHAVSLAFNTVPVAREGGAGPVKGEGEAGAVAAQVVLAPGCGMAGATPGYARAAMERCREAARLLPELIEEERT